jgi:hypothetical protein
VYILECCSAQSVSMIARNDGIASGVRRLQGRDLLVCWFLIF